MEPTETTASPQWQQIGFGGSCHWCTEAIFQALRGVHEVRQGFIAADGENQALSEAVLVHFSPADITLHNLIAIHLHTHSSTANHSMRDKYRSAIYVFSPEQADEAAASLQLLQQDFDQPIVTRVLPFIRFEASPERYQNYFATDPGRPFCQTYIHPKLQALRARFTRLVKEQEEK